MKNLIFIALSLSFNLCIAQSTFQRLYKDTNQYLMFRSAIEVDSGYLVNGMGTAPSTQTGHDDAFIYKLDYNGNPTLVYYDHNDTLFLTCGFTGSNLLKTINNTIFNIYTANKVTYDKQYIRMQELTLNGAIISDYFSSYIYDSINYYGLDYESSCQINDSTYAFTMNANSYHPDSINFLQSISLHRIHSNSNFNYFQNFRDFNNDAYNFVIMDITKTIDGNVLISGYRRDVYSLSKDREMDILLILLDQNLNLIEKFIYHTSDHLNRLYPGTLSTQDTGYLIPHLEGNWRSANLNNPQAGDFYYKNKITKLDKDFNLEWSFFVKENDSIRFHDQAVREIKAVTDSTFVAITSNVFFLDSLIYYPSYDSYDSILLGSEIIHFDIHGNKIWKRQHYLFSNVDNAVPYKSNFLRDVIPTSDGGYLCVGDHSTYAYALKLNCLGFLGNPKASAQHTSLDNYQVHFTNTSAMAGSYTWYFGDGDTLHTDEYTTIINHTYPQYGTYHVTLIAHGCQGIADTIHYVVNAVLNNEGDQIVEGDTGVFTVFPNPATTGAFINVFIHQDLQINNPQLNIYNAQGKLVQSLNISHHQGTYHLLEHLAAGNYTAVLLYGTNKISKKFVVL